MLQELMANHLLLGILVFFGTFMSVYFIIPKIIWVVTSRDLIDHPVERSAHKISTPTMAGYSFFLSIIIAILFIKQWDIDLVGLNIVAGLSLIFTVGLKDDLVLSTPRAKLAGEITAILFVVSNTYMQINSLDGFLGIHIIPIAIAISFSVLMILTIINAYNLIDGLDGLAAIIGMVIFSIYALIFYITGLFFYFFLSLSLMGALASYLRYNVSKEKKIFMGDTGSLIIGFFLGIFTLKFMAMDTALFSNFSFYPENKLIVVAAILWIPLFDMFRVIGVRLLQGKSPLYPDRNHIHHLLSDLGLSHINTALILGFINYLLVILLIFLSSRLNSFYMMGVLALLFVIFLGIFNRIKKKVR